MVTLGPAPVATPMAGSFRRRRPASGRRRWTGDRRLRWAIASGALILLTGCIGFEAPASIPPSVAPTGLSPAEQVSDPAAGAPLAAAPIDSDPNSTGPDSTGPDSREPISADPSITSLPVIVVPAPSVPAWQLNGSAMMIDNELQLTDADTQNQVGSAFWPVVQTDAQSLTATFDITIGDGTGADGLTLAVLDADLAEATSVGEHGGALGWSGLPGFAVAIDTFQNGFDPSYSTVGMVTGFSQLESDQLQWAEHSAAVPRLRGPFRHVEAVIADGRLTVTLDGVSAVVAPAVLPHRMMVGFTAANGGRTDRHAVSGVSITIS